MDKLTSTLKALKLSAAETAAAHPWSRLLTNFKSCHISDQPGMSSGQSRANPIEIEDERPLPNDRRQNNRRIHADDGDQCPTYFDAQLNCLMYRGPGYEDFPVAYVSDPSFQKVVDDWKQRNPRQSTRLRSQIPPTGARNRRERNGNSPSLSPPTTNQHLHLLAPNLDSDSATFVAQQKFEEESLIQVLQIFPNIDRDFVRKRCQEWLAQHVSSVDPSLTHSDPSAIAEIITAIADLDTYPEQIKKRKRSASTERKEFGHIEWGQDESLPTEPSYFRRGLKLLADTFRHVPTHEIHKKLTETGRVFDTYRHFASTETNYHSIPVKPYKRLRNPRLSIEQKYVYQYKLQHEPPMEYPYLVNELQAAKKAWHEECRQAKRRKDEEDAETANLKEHASAGMLVDCQCCFDEIPINRSVPCDGEQVHFYCRACVKNLAASLIGQMQYELKCMYPGSVSCTAPISRSSLRQVLEAKTMSKLEEMQQNAEIGEADLEGLEECPFCDFKAVCDPVDIDREFVCGNGDCAKTSCRLCRNMTHVPLTCEEAKQQRDKDRGTALRHDVEEAMTRASMRNCPNPRCKVPIIKEYGCNKMICGKCHTMLCYVCGKDITRGRGGGYEHFSLPGSPCKLHDEQEPQREARQVAKAQKEAIDRVRRDNPDIEEAALVVPHGPAATQTPRGPQFQRRHHGGFGDLEPMMMWPDDVDRLFLGRNNPHAPPRPVRADFPRPNGIGLEAIRPLMAQQANIQRPEPDELGQQLDAIRHDMARRANDPLGLEPIQRAMAQQANAQRLDMDFPFQQIGRFIDRPQPYGHNGLDGMDNPQTLQGGGIGGNGDTAGGRFVADPNGVLGDNVRPQAFAFPNQAPNYALGIENHLGLDGFVDPMGGFAGANMMPPPQPLQNDFWVGDWLPDIPAIPPWFENVQPNGDGRHLNL